MISCKIEVLPLVVDCSLPPLLPACRLCRRRCHQPCFRRRVILHPATPSACRSPLVRCGPAPVVIETVATGAAAARRVHHTSNRGDDGIDARGSMTTTADVRILTIPNTRTTRETSLPPPSLGISRGALPPPAIRLSFIADQLLL